METRGTGGEYTGSLPLFTPRKTPRSSGRESAMNALKMEYWIPWLAAALLTAVNASAFVFGNFETKGDSFQKKIDLEKRLDRIENSLDTIVKLLYEKQHR